MEYGNNLLSKEQEKELLSSLAIAEIELNQTNIDNLNSKGEKNSISNIKVINKSYLGFMTVSFIFVIFFLFYKQPEIFIGKNMKFEQELLIIVDYIDILITNLIHFISF